MSVLGEGPMVAASASGARRVQVGPGRPIIGPRAGVALMQVKAAGAGDRSLTTDDGTRRIDNLDPRKDRT
jgi:hypothetical protein